MVISLWWGCFISISGSDLDSRGHFHSKSFQRFFYFNKIWILYTHGKSLWESIQISCITHFIWLNLYDAEAFFQFRVVIRILELISSPNHSSDSFILINLNTLHSWKGCVRVNSNLWYNSLNWPYLYDADDIFQFRVLIRILEVISSPNHSRDSFICIKLETYRLCNGCVIFNSNLWNNSHNWPYLYNADIFFQFWVLIRIREVISIPNHSRDSFIWIKLTTYHIWKEGVIVNSNLWYNSRNWLNLFDADAFFQFRVLIRIREVNYIPIHSRDSFF